LAIYLSVTILTIVYIINGSPAVILALLVILMAAFIAGVTLFMRETIKLYHVANRMKDLYHLSAGPRIGLFLVACAFFALKLASQSYLIYQSLEISGGLNELFLTNYKQNLEGGLSGIFYLVGEFGSLLSLIILIKRHSHGQHSKSFTDSTMSVIDDMDDRFIEATHYERYIENSIHITLND